MSERHEGSIAKRWWCDSRNFARRFGQDWELSGFGAERRAPRQPDTKAETHHAAHCNVMLFVLVICVSGLPRAAAAQTIPGQLVEFAFAPNQLPHCESGVPVRLYRFVKESNGWAQFQCSVTS